MLGLTTLFAGAAQAQTEVPLDWALNPSGLGGGDSFRLLFISSTSRNATSSDIAVYNTFVQERAATGHAAIQVYSADFRVVCCTASDDAIDNTSTTDTDTDAPIYWLDGGKLADDYNDFYDGTWDLEGNAQDRDETGNNTVNTTQASGNVFTGCDHDGTADTPLGDSPTVRFGRLNVSGAAGVS